MSQATTWSVPLVGPATPTEMATRMNDTLNALRTLHSGTSRPSYAVAQMLWVDTTTTPWVLKCYDGTDDISIATIDATTNEAMAFGGVQTQCRLVYSSTAQIRLDRFDGKRLFINGRNEVIPSGGVTLANTGIGNSVLRYIYAYMVGTTMTLEASATAYATDGTNGHKIKTGDATRTLVGMVRTDAGGLFFETAALVGVASYYNRRSRRAALESSGLATVSTTGVIAAATVGVLNWADEAVDHRISGYNTNSSSGATNQSAAVMDGATYGQPSVNFTPATGASSPVSLGEGLAPAEGYHIYGISLAVTAGTGTWNINQSVGTRC